MNKVLIIAEAGVNHNGSLELAKQLVDVAADTGADIVKFQTFKAEKLVDLSSPKAEYQKQSTNSSETQFAMLKKLELSEDDHLVLLKYCKSKNIKFLSTPFDLDGIDFLHSLGMDIFKIPSGEITNLPHLRKIASFNKKTILSTGMSNLQEVKAAVYALLQAGLSENNLSLLHCTTEYPAPLADVNLNAMVTLKREFGLSVGYSDHTQGIEVAIAAVALGAEIIEKHFTLDKNMEGPDHLASLDPAELKTMISSIRNIEIALGDGQKIVTPSEKKNIDIARKSIVAAIDIKCGELFSETCLTTKRVAFGMSPMKWDEVVGRVAKRDFKIGELIEL